MLKAIDKFYLLDRLNRYEALEGLRGAACCAVFCVHLFACGHSVHDYHVTPGSMLHTFIGILHSGMLGVDLFFILSGFLVGSIAFRKGLQLGSFIEHRFERLIPPQLFIVLFVMFAQPVCDGRTLLWFCAVIVALYFAAPLIFSQSRLWLAIFAAYLLMMALFILEVTFHGSLVGNPNATHLGIVIMSNTFGVAHFFPGIPDVNFVAWTLGYEFLFYSVFAIVWAALYVRSRRLGNAAMVIIAAGVFLASVVCGRSSPIGDANRCLGFGMGLLLAQLGADEKLWSRLRHVFAAAAAPSLIVIVILMYLWRWASTQEWSCYLFFAAVDVAGFFLIGGLMLPGSLVSRIFRFKGLRILGAISYSFYLVHPFAIAIVAQMFDIIGPRRMWVHFALSFALTCLLASAIYLVLERPYFMKKLKSAGDSKSQPQLSADQRAAIEGEKVSL